ncbi:hypothetical protein BDV93DRAFT_363393 [Ceratobasidium sp. AG-I]|nr:hypothetical protein BDV93DRAFT_363393 [Ceratobasidium sp. AG-I]
MGLRTDLYICTTCHKTFGTTMGSTFHTVRSTQGCYGKTIMLQSKYRRLLKDQLEQTTPTQSPPVVPSDNANPQLASLQSNAVPEMQCESNTYLLPIPEPNSSLSNLRLLDPGPNAFNPNLQLPTPNPNPPDSSFAFDSCLFDPPSFNLSSFDPLTFDRPAFDLPAFDPPALNPAMFGASVANLGRQPECEMESYCPGLFWNPWTEGVEGAQHESG